MILSEASEKYNVPLDWLCRVVFAAGVEPTGERQGKRKLLKEYPEKLIVDTILADYKRRFMQAKHEAENWKIKATRIQTIYMRDLPPPYDDD